jgi:hypothetical protein
LTLTKLSIFDYILNINCAPSTQLLFIVCSFKLWTKSAFKFSASSSFLTFHWMSILVCKVKVFCVFIIFLCIDVYYFVVFLHWNLLFGSFALHCVRIVCLFA